MFKVPEKYRLKNHPLVPSTEQDGNNGGFLIPHYRIDGYQFYCQASDGYGWEHLSITVRKKGKPADRTPTWAEMCWLKDLFWGNEDCVMQLHPSESQHISTHNFCLHLWRPIGQPIPQPPSIMVGSKDLEHDKLKNASVEELKKILKDAIPKNK